MNELSVRRAMRIDLQFIDAIGGSHDLVACHISDPGAICLVAELGGNIVGYLCSVSDMCVHQILDVAVDHRKRRLGIGTSLIEHIRLMTWPSMSLEAVVDVSDTQSVTFLAENDFTAVDAPGGNSILFRSGWRFRKAPPLPFRRTHKEA